MVFWRSTETGDFILGRHVTVSVFCVFELLRPTALARLASLRLRTSRLQQPVEIDTAGRAAAALLSGLPAIRRCRARPGPADSARKGVTGLPARYGPGLGLSGAAQTNR